MIGRAALLESLLADPSRAAEVSREEAVALLVALSTLQAALVTTVSRLPSPGHTGGKHPIETAGAPPWSPDDLLTVDEAAAMLRVAPRWLYRHARTLPFARKLSAKVLRFSRAGIARWLATRRT